MLGRGRRGPERAGAVAGGLRSFRNFVRPIDAATLRSEGRRRFLRPVRTCGIHQSCVPLARATGRPEWLAGEERSDRSLTRSRKTGDPNLKAGEARGKEEEAKGSKMYLSPRLSRSPDVSGSRAGRRRSSGRSGRRPSRARVGATSERPSGASQMISRKLYSSGEGSALLGSQNAAGGRGGCLLLLRPGGVFWKIAGGAVGDSG